MVDIKEIKRKARITTASHSQSRLSVRVESELLQEFNLACRENGRTSASVIVTLMKDYIAKEGKR